MQKLGVCTDRGGPVMEGIGRAEGLRPDSAAAIALAMTRVLYAVIATLPDERLAGEYLAWLEDGHVEQVIKGGAHSAMIVKLERAAGDGLPAGARRVMTQYVFTTREVFDRYVEHFAPALRAEGLAKFGPERGVRMERVMGEIV